MIDDTEERDLETLDVEPYTAPPEDGLARTLENGHQDDDPDPEYVFDETEEPA